MAKKTKKVKKGKNLASPKGFLKLYMAGTIVFFLAVVVATCYMSWSIEEGRLWVVLVAGAGGYNNYALEADICHASQLLQHGGVKTENLITMMKDDIAWHPKNIYPGVLINHPQGSDVYRGTPKDYTGENMTIDNLIAVLTGDKDSLKGGSGKVLSPNRNDRVFVFFSGHGTMNHIQVGDELLSREQLLESLLQNHKRNNFKSMVLYLCSCMSGSMFSKYDDEYKKMNIYVMTSSNVSEISHKVYRMKKFNTTLATHFGSSWMKDSESHDRKKRTLKQQYNRVHRLLLGDDDLRRSHVMRYGAKGISANTLDLYHGFDEKFKRF